MNFYYQIASKADYISDIARDIAGFSAGSSIMDTAKAADILRQLQNIADVLDEIAPTFQDVEDYTD